MNDLLVCERLATATQGNTLMLTRENVLPPFSGGQVVAGSNPVSPTAGQRLFWGLSDRLFGGFDPHV